MMLPEGFSPDEVRASYDNGGLTVKVPAEVVDQPKKVAIDVSTSEKQQVYLYFQGPAVRVLAKGFRPKLKGWARPFSRFAASDMTKSGHIPAQEKLRQLHSLGAHLYMCGGSMEPFKVSREDLIFDDLPIVEYLTFMSIMEEADIPLYV